MIKDIELINAIKFCLKVGLPLTERQRAYYLLFMASLEEIAEYLRKEKG